MVTLLDHYIVISLYDCHYSAFCKLILRRHLYCPEIVKKLLIQFSIHKKPFILNLLFKIVTPYAVHISYLEDLSTMCTLNTTLQYNFDQLLSFSHDSALLDQ